MALLTEDEAAVYDRQLRVWGVETQRKCAAIRCSRAAPVFRTDTAQRPRVRLSSARVLVINVTGVAAEVRAALLVSARRCGEAWREQGLLTQRRTGVPLCAHARAAPRRQMCKNICLAGVGSLSLLDGTPAARAAPGNFLVPSDAPHDMRRARSPRSRPRLLLSRSL